MTVPSLTLLPSSFLFRCDISSCRFSRPFLSILYDSFRSASMSESSTILPSDILRNVCSGRRGGRCGAGGGGGEGGKSLVASSRCISRSLEGSTDRTEEGFEWVVLAFDGEREFVDEPLWSLNLGLDLLPVPSPSSSGVLTTLSGSFGSNAR